MPASSLRRSVSPRGKLSPPLLHLISASNVSVVASHQRSAEEDSEISAGSGQVRTGFGTVPHLWSFTGSSNTGPRLQPGLTWPPAVRAFGPAVPSFARSSAAITAVKFCILLRGRQGC